MEKEVVDRPRPEVVERALGRREVGTVFGVATASVDRYERAGIIPPRRRLSTGRVVWLLSEVLAALAALPVGPLADRTAKATAARGAQRARGRATR